MDEWDFNLFQIFQFSRSVSELGQLSELQKKVFKAVKKDDIKEVKTTLQNKSVEDITGKNGNSICHVAAKYGKLSILREYGGTMMEKNFRNKVGDSWLHEAARYGKTDVAIFILEHFREPLKKQVNVNNRGEHFIDGALFTLEISREQKIEFIKGLNEKSSLELQEIIEIISKGKQTVEAEKGTKKDQTDGLRKSGENNVKTMLHKIAAHGFSELVSFFDFEGLDKKDERENTAFHVAAKYGQLETLHELVTSFEHRSAKCISRRETEKNNKF